MSLSRTMSSQDVTAKISRRVRSAVDVHGQNMKIIRNLALKSGRKIVLLAEDQRVQLPDSQKALPCQKTHFPVRRNMPGEEQESSPASIEPRVSIKHMLSQIRGRRAGQPGESPERHRRHSYDGLVLQIVLLAGSMLLL